MNLAWRIRNAIERRVRELTLFGGSLNRETAEARAIAEIVQTEKAKLRAHPGSAFDLFEPVPVFTNVDPGPHFWRAKADEFKRLMMTPLTRTPAPPPAAAAPIPAPRPTARKQRTATGAPKATQPKPTEPSRPVPPVYVSGARTPHFIDDEFDDRYDSPATQAWRASTRGHA